jgi:exodeoxyribonuclease VII small subunit
MGKKVKSAKPAEPAEIRFEEALANLEQIVHDLEDGQLPLHEALAQYEKGVQLLKGCFYLLERAERRIELLRGIGTDGRAVTEPLDQNDEDEDNDDRTRLF